jgi:hypothetical protein
MKSETHQHIKDDKLLEHFKDVVRKMGELLKKLYRDHPALVTIPSRMLCKEKLVSEEQQS